MAQEELPEAVPKETEQQAPEEQAQDWNPLRLRSLRLKDEDRRLFIVTFAATVLGTVVALLIVGLLIFFARWSSHLHKTTYYINFPNWPTWLFDIVGYGGVLALVTLPFLIYVLLRKTRIGRVLRVLGWTIAILLVAWITAAALGSVLSQGK